MTQERDGRNRAPTAGGATIAGVELAVSIIDLLAESGRPVKVQQVADLLGMTKSRASRHLANLAALGLVERRGQGSGYRLGWRLLRWGHVAARDDAIGEVLAAPLDTLSRALDQTVLLCKSTGSDAVVVKSLVAPTAPIRIEVKLGAVLGLPRSPSARVVFAFQPAEQRRRLLSHLREREEMFRVRDEAGFVREIAAIQERLMAWTRDKFDMGYGAVAAPVFDQDEALAAVVTVMLPSALLADGPPPAVADALRACCQRCSALLRSRMRF